MAIGDSATKSWTVYGVDALAPRSCARARKIQLRIVWMLVKMVRSLRE